MTEIPTTVIGLMGLIITTLLGVIGRLYFQNIGLWKQIVEIQNERVVQSEITRDKLALPLQQISQYVELTYRKLIKDGE